MSTQANQDEIKTLRHRLRMAIAHGFLELALKTQKQINALKEAS